MNKTVSLLYVSASVLALASPVWAQSAKPTPASAAASSDTGLEEIVITARRQQENLQDVPQTVNAVTSETLQKLNLRQFTDIQSVVPGLTLSSQSASYESQASMRGISFDVTSQSQPTTALYLNDAPVQAEFVFQSLFDVGQIEVLKGPQGTTRGISAPSGAITVTTRKPDMSSYGGYVDGSLTDLRGRNINGAVNVPIVQDVLAARISAVYDYNSFDGVRSIHNTARPAATNAGARASLRFEPSDAINVNMMYQHLERKVAAFEQVAGPGQGTPFSIGNTVFPASTNPPFTPQMRLSVSDQPSRSTNTMDFFVAQADAQIFGQHLIYVGSYQHQHIHDLATGGSNQGGDAGNLLPGVETIQDNVSISTQTTQELRIASDPGPGRLFDYTAGGFYNWNHGTGFVATPGPLLPGAFGFGAAPDITAYNPAYQWPAITSVNSAIQETSLFANAALHLGANTELNGGVRHIWSVVRVFTPTSLGTGLYHAGFPCAFLTGFFPGTTTASTPGDCLVPGPPIPNSRERDSASPTIYSVTLSHHFSPDFMAYANTGTTFRPATAHIPFSGPLVADANPAVAGLQTHPPEHAQSYELGFKSTFLDNRARLNVSIYKQDFHNLVVYIPNINYFNGQSPTNFPFTASVNASVKGVDADGAFQVTPHWNIAAAASYADGKIKGSKVPCNTNDATGAPTFNTDGLISLCSGGSASRQPLWNATFQSEYTHPVQDNIDGFVRGLLTYYPSNNNRAEPNFNVSNYALMNLYFGVRSNDGAWEVSLFARNLFDTTRVLDQSPVQEQLNTPLGPFFPQLIHASGYYQTAMTPRREFGIHVQYAFGSR